MTLVAMDCDNALIVGNDDPIHARHIAIIENPRMQKIIFNLVDMEFAVVHDTVDVWIGPLLIPSSPV